MKTCTRNKALFFFAAACISLSMTTSFAATHRQNTEAKAQPSIQVKELVFDFGEILEGTEVEHEFIVRNTGMADLNIERVQVD